MAVLHKTVKNNGGGPKIMHGHITSICGTSKTKSNYPNKKKNGHTFGQHKFYNAQHFIQHSFKHCITYDLRMQNQ